MQIQSDLVNPNALVPWKNVRMSECTDYWYRVVQISPLVFTFKINNFRSISVLARGRQHVKDLFTYVLPLNITPCNTVWILLNCTINIAHENE